MNNYSYSPRESPATIEKTLKLADKLYKPKKSSYSTDSWHLLKQAWRSYKMARLHDDKEKMIEYAKRINELQINMGVIHLDFPELNTQ